MAEASRLKPFEYLDMIGDFAKAFGQHPDKVYIETSFDTVTKFLLSWKEQKEFEDRYMEADRLLNPPKV